MDIFAQTKVLEEKVKAIFGIKEEEKISAKEKLAEFKNILDKEMSVYFDEKISAAGKIAPEAKEIIEHLKDLTLRGGKRIRAALLYYSYLAHGGKDKDEALKASMAMEMSETYLLTHDDIIDDDTLRRGGITIHADYEKICKTRYHKKVDPKHFGNSIAIMAGDAACAMSNEILSTLNFSPQCRVRAIEELNKIYIREVYGETLDVIIELRKKPTKDDVRLVQELKTAPYTFDSPMKLGAILAGASEEQIRLLENYTVPLGTAFQIQDDILGMFGSEDKTGKPAISDMREGKITLLVLDSLEVADQNQKDIINNNLGNKKITYRDLDEVRKVVVETGAFEKSKKFAMRLAKKSYAELEQVKLDKEGKDFLLGIAEYMVDREY